MTEVTTRRRQGKSSAATKAKQGILLDIGCGNGKQERFVGMDRQALPGVDIVHDWNVFPWPLDDESVLTALAIHVVEHVNPLDGHFLRWMDEVWRVLVPEGQFAIVTPYGGSRYYWRDPTHVNGCTEETFFYFDPLHPSAFWSFYQAKPWCIEKNDFLAEGNIEVVLRKRRDEFGNIPKERENGDGN